MKKFLLTISLIFIISMISAPFCFADGSYTDTTKGYTYSITIKTPIGIVDIIQAKNPFFVTGDSICLLGEYTMYQLSGDTPIISSGNLSVLTPFRKFSEILESSVDVYDYVTKQLVYQSEQTDNVVISNAVVDEFRGYQQNSISLLTSIYVFISFAITICAGGFVIYLVLKPLFYFIR